VTDFPAGAPAFPRVTLLPGKSRLFYSRHPWVFPGAIAFADSGIPDGAVVQLCSHTGSFIGWGFFNSRSRVRVRLHSWEKERPPSPALWRDRIRSAIRLRREQGLMDPDGACRLINSEGDHLSGLVADRFGPWLSVQVSSLGLSQRLSSLLAILADETRCRGIILRQDKEISKLEGIEQADGPCHGEAPPPRVEFLEHGLRIGVNLAEGQKTGYYLDQRENRLAVAPLAKGRTVLDAFTYAGGYALRAAQAGARSIVAIDQSHGALEMAAENARINELDGRVSWLRAEVFEDLAARVETGQKFGLLILDPPKFARAKNRVDEALGGYRRLFSLAFRLAEEDSRLVLCSCTGSVTRNMLLELISQVAAEERRDARLIRVSGAAADHPIASSCPESEYLKCFVLGVS